MATSTITFSGRVPMPQGAYDSSTAYTLNNLVTLYGMTFRALGAVAAGYPPAELDSDGNVSLVNTDLWELMAGSEEVYNASDRLDELDDVLNGDTAVPIAENLESWADRDTLSVEDTWSGIVQTTGGSTSLDSSEDSLLVSIVAKENFYASALVNTGYNLLRNAVGVGSGYYFLVPALPFGTYGTATQPNGILFTNSANENLTPTVYFKALSNGVPTSVTDGAVCSYTDSNGHRFYTTAEAGYIIVSGITLASTCAHVGWSKRYDEYIAYDDSYDAGSSVILSGIISTLHSYNLMLKVGNVSDRLDYYSSTKIQWTRNCDRTAPSWTTEENNDGTYTHSATISAMESGSYAYCGDSYGEEDTDITLTTDGTTVYYIDSSSSATGDYVYYQLATSATGTVTLTPSGAIEDWGLTYLADASGDAYVTQQYAQGYPDSMAALVSGGLETKHKVIAQAIADIYAKIEALEAVADKLGDAQANSIDALEYKSYLYPTILRGAGAPSSSVTPDNLPDGLPWDGIPVFIGQEYMDTTNQVVYKAWGVTSVSDWVAV